MFQVCHNFQEGPLLTFVKLMLEPYKCKNFYITCRCWRENTSIFNNYVPATWNILIHGKRKIVCLNILSEWLKTSQRQKLLYHVQILRGNGSICMLHFKYFWLKISQKSYFREKQNQCPLFQRLMKRGPLKTCMPWNSTTVGCCEEMRVSVWSN